MYNHVKKYNDHVLYRVTLYQEEGKKLAYGVQMEAKSINEQSAERLSFNVFAYNIQPGIDLCYETGKIVKKDSLDLLSRLSKAERNYVINKKKKKFHLESCASVCYIDDKIEKYEKGEELINKGYRPCAICDSELRK